MCSYRACAKTFYISLKSFKGGYGKYCCTSCQLRDRALPLKERFFKHFGTPNKKGCIEWKGSIGVFGYGRIAEGKKFFQAHRLSYIYNRGHIPEGLIVCHQCDNPPCVNPKHLFLGTYKDNTQDCHSKMRHNFGTKNGQAKLNDEKIRAIRKRYKEGASYYKIADEFGINFSNVGYIVKRKTWRHVL